MGGGAATHAGIDFQQRVSAWFLVMILLERDTGPELALPASFVPTQISYETSTSIDDLRVGSALGPALLMQAKRSLSVSTQPASEFAKVIDQFVRQYRSDEQSNNSDNRYILVVSPKASRKVQVVLANLLDAYREHRDGPDVSVLDKQAKGVLESFVTVVQAAATTHLGAEFSNDAFRGFAVRTHVWTCDIEHRRPHESGALVLLSVRTQLPGEMVWAYLVKYSLTVATRRGRLDIIGIRGLLAPFERQGDELPEPVKEELQASLPLPPSGRELIFGTMDGSKEFDLYLLEFYRFDETGAKRLRFENDRYTCRNENGSDGLTGRVIARAATQDGLLRQVLRIEMDRSDTLGIMFSDSLRSHDDSEFARAWAKRTQAVMGDLTKCVHCGRTVGHAKFEFVEVDDDVYPHRAGAVHPECLRSIDRVLGQIQWPFFEGLEQLRDFDPEVWVTALGGGQRLLNELRGREARQVRIGWNHENADMQPHGWCIRLEAKDGFYCYLHTRGRLHRLRKLEADARAKKMSEDIQWAAARGKPMCVSDDNWAVGRREALEQMGVQEPYHECSGATPVRYSLKISAESQENGNYYAPLFYLVGIDDEEPVVFGEFLVLFSDPMAFPDMLAQLEAVGLRPPVYSIRILANDQDFDRFMIEAGRRARPVIIDPVPIADEPWLGGIEVVSHPEALRGAFAQEEVVKALTRQVVIDAESRSQRARSRRKRRRNGPAAP